MPACAYMAFFASVFISNMQIYLFGAQKMIIDYVYFIFLHFQFRNYSIRLQFVHKKGRIVTEL